MCLTGFFPSSSPEGKIVKTVKGRRIYSIVSRKKVQLDHTITIPASGGQKFLIIENTLRKKNDKKK